MIYKINNHANNVLDLDNTEVYDHIYAACGLDDKSSDYDIIEAFKHLTRTPVELHKIAAEIKIPIYDLIRIVCTERPDLIDTRFLTRMRKLYNTIGK